MSWLSSKIEAFVVWFAAAIHAVFSAIVSYLQDFVVWVVSSILSAIVTLFSSISVPAFLSNGLAPLFNALPPSLLYFINATSIVDGLAIIGVGVLFRLIRKVVTLGQW